MMIILSMHRRLSFTATVCAIRNWSTLNLPVTVPATPGQSSTLRLMAGSRLKKSLNIKMSEPKISDFFDGLSGFFQNPSCRADRLKESTVCEQNENSEMELFCCFYQFKKRFQLIFRKINLPDRKKFNSLIMSSDC